MSNQVIVTKGKNGNVIVSYLTMMAAYSIAKRMDGSIGLARQGDLIVADGLDEAVAATMADGVKRVLSVDAPAMTQEEHAAFDASRQAIETAMTLNGKTY